MYSYQSVQCEVLSHQCCLVERHFTICSGPVCVVLASLYILMLTRAQLDPLDRLEYLAQMDNQDKLVHLDKTVLMEQEETTEMLVLLEVTVLLAHLVILV